jgi:hypothetical protein
MYRNASAWLSNISSIWALLKNTMKFGDPAFLAFCQWFVIQMGVANENIIHNGERD